MPEQTQTNPAEGAQAQSGSIPTGFVPITTQGEFDHAVKNRLERANRQFREENKDVFEKAAAYDELVEKNKSDLEKANDRANKAESELANFKKREEIATWKQEVSKETGVPADVLRGDTKEELTAHAESLKAVMGTTSKNPAFVQSDGFAPRSHTGSKTTREQFAETVSDFLGD